MGAGIINGIIPSGGSSFRGALTNLTANEPITLAGGNVAVPWDAAVYDTDSLWAGGAPTRLTVPAGVTKVKLLGAARWDATTASRTALIGKNGDPTTDIDGLPWERNVESRGEMSIVSAVINVVEGDYFELFLSTSADTNAIIQNTWFAMEIIE